MNITNRELRPGSYELLAEFYHRAYLVAQRARIVAQLAEIDDELDSIEHTLRMLGWLPAEETP